MFISSTKSDFAYNQRRIMLSLGTRRDDPISACRAQNSGTGKGIVCDARREWREEGIIMPRRKRKAANGDGTIYHCKDGRWGAAIWVNYPDGRKKRVYYYSRDRNKCVEWLVEKRLQKARGQVECCDNITLYAWLRIWLEHYTPNIRGSTRMNYQGYLENYINTSKIASLPLAKVTTGVLQVFAISLRKTGQPDTGGLSDKSIRNLFSMLNAALKQAVGNGLLLRNPCDYVQLPQVKQKEIQPLSDTEIANLLAATKGERYGIAVLLLLFGGFRIGEPLALRHSSLLESDGIWYLRVQQSVNRVTNFGALPGEPKTVLRLGETKSAKSKRDVPLLPQVLTALREHMQCQREAAASSWGLYEADPFLISNELGGFIDPTTFRSWFNQKVERAGISRHIRVHDCRHTAATMMLQGGATPPAVSLILGHCSSQVTERFYLHPDLGIRAEAVGHLSAAADSLPR